MMKKQILPLGRSQELVEYSNREFAVLCYAPHNPHYYKNNKGEYRAIDLEPEEAKGKFDMLLSSKNIVSMGLKRNGDSKKYMGLRPDVDQSGAEQLEFTLLSVNLDNEKQKIETGQPLYIDTCTQTVGDKIVIKNNRQRSRQCWLVDRPVKHFEIRYKLDVKGMIFKSHKDEFWFYSIKTGEFRFRITQPSILNVGFDKLPVPGLSHLLVRDGGDLIYIKKNLQPLDIKEEKYYIDAEVVYSDTDDGFCQFNFRVASNDPDAYWTYARNHDQATEIDTTGDFQTMSYIHETTSGSTVYQTAIIRRNFTLFDTSSSIFGNVLAASLFIKSNTGSHYVKMSAQEGTQGSTLDAYDYDNFTGTYYGYLTYWASTGSWNEIEFNDLGMSKIGEGANGYTFICCREYNYDYKYVTPPDDTEFDCIGYSSNEYGTDDDPYLRISIDWSHKIFGTDDYKKILGIDRKDIISINGIVD